MRDWQTAIKYPQSRDRMRWRQRYRRSVCEFHCFFVPPSISLFSLFPFPLTFLLYLCQKKKQKKNLFGAFRALPAPVLKVFLHNMARQRGGEWRHVWPQTVIKPIQMQSVTCYILASVTPGKETSVKRGHRHRLWHRCHGKLVALANRVDRRRQRSQRFEPQLQLSTFSSVFEY